MKNSDTPSDPKPMQAFVDFVCADEECQATVRFNLMGLRESKGRVSCAECHREYRFDRAFIEKLERFRRLILALQEAEDILGDASIAVSTPMGEVKVPYRLLLTRLNTSISLDMGDRRADFNFRVEPLNNGSFR
ncbi:MAG: hypothetical protein GXP31_04460 [Kiritimatiellaeota bacterium]|nr:hypothetical protein [Kiritimatiellota bacterium]